MSRGKFFVIDGTDGSGKATQTERLIERMKQEGMQVWTIAFPQYDTKSAGPVELYLRERAYPDITAKQASVLFAVDRFDAARQIREKLDAGVHVIADRYVTSNMAHQGGKIKNTGERHAFWAWEEEFEFGLLDLPRPDMNIILHVPAEVSISLIESRGEEKDLHEADPEHLRDAERTYIELAQKMKGCNLIECAPGGELLSRDAVHDLVWKEASELLS